MDVLQDILTKRRDLICTGRLPKYLIVNQWTFNTLRKDCGTYLQTTPDEWRAMDLLIAVIPYSHSKEYYAEVA